MKRILSSIVMFVFVVASTYCFAAPVDTLTGGLKDIVTSPVIVTDNVKTEMNAAKFMPFGVVGGAAKGTFYMGKKIVDSLWSIVTIPYHMAVK